MTETKTCGANVGLADDTTLTCTLDPGHFGPVHDDHGHRWGDPNLPPPPVSDDLPPL